MKDYINNNGSLPKRNTSYQRPFVYQSGKSNIPTIAIKAKNPLKLEKIQKINNPIESREFKDRKENLYKENNIRNYKESLSKTLNKTNFVSEYLNLVRCSQPYCTCANCIQKKNKDINKLPTYSYQANIKSNYRNEFDWKQQDKATSFQNAKMSHLDKGFKEYIKPGLESVMHKDYKNTSENIYYNTISRENLNENNLTELSDNNKNQLKSLKNRNSDVQMNVPFLGRSSYDTQFPQWSTMANNKTKYEKHIMNNEIPFSGKSSYMSTYGNFEDKYYKEKTNPILKKDNLEVGSGNLITYTSTGDTYRPLDYKMVKDLNSLKSARDNAPANLRTAPFSKDSFLSTYEKAFMGNHLITK